ncbi:MAG: hypothetical protein HY241_14015 [Actinobacteria bacterium]|nr:hypothetical protein [Actinomycetota bacterium]
MAYYRDYDGTTRLVGRVGARETQARQGLHDPGRYFGRGTASEAATGTASGSESHAHTMHVTVKDQENSGQMAADLRCCSPGWT